MSVEKESEEWKEGKKAGPMATGDLLNVRLRDLNEGLDRLARTNEENNRLMTELIGVLKRR